MAEQFPAVAEEARMICGYPKTGRTWLRFILGSYFSGLYALGVEPDFNNIYSLVPNHDSERIAGQPVFGFEGTVPKVEMSHSQYDSDVHESANVTFLTRDPRDIMVSHWLHNKNQLGIFNGGLSEFIRGEQDGVPRFIRHLESWAPHLNPHQVVIYEDMRSDTIGSFARVLENLRLPNVDALVQAAVSQSTIDKMRQKESERGIAGHLYDRANPEAVRVRRGVVGGYVDYLSPDDQSYVLKKLAKLTDSAKAIIALTGSDLF